LINDTIGLCYLAYWLILPYPLTSVLLCLLANIALPILINVIFRPTWTAPLICI